ncbi:MAG: hypothetical protein MJA27_36410 [Pseudanabaenales cyanobacterium]|nr:hypothetical protein [Pseudanabaenales cyanobacterium]
MEAELEIARQQAVSLQQQIVNLKADLRLQRDRSDQLTADLEQMKGQVEKKGNSVRACHG